MGFKRFIWSPVTDAYLGEQDETGATIATYTQEPVPYGSLISQRRGGKTSHYHYDGLGNTRELTSASEVVTDTNLYDGWGVNVASTGTTESPFKWRGQDGYYFDEVTADYYVRARVYQPLNGRWSSMDPLLFIDGGNRYVAYFVPIGIDLSGLSVIVCDNPCTPNGCGAADARLDPVPDDPLCNDFAPCCDLHDVCYCDCGIDKAACDDMFEQCMRQYCDTEYPRKKLRIQPLRRECMMLTGTYAKAVRRFGQGPFDSGQDIGCANCRCVDTPVA